MSEKLPPAEFRKVYRLVPRLCVDLLIPSPAGYLLTRRDIDPGKGFWHFPGGTILMGESIYHAAQRIAQEEIGLTIDNAEFMGHLEY
ncbi:MAG: hypothetical protein Kow00127_07400 [Bacteroidales bacterium]